MKFPLCGISFEIKGFPVVEILAGNKTEKLWIENWNFCDQNFWLNLLETIKSFEGKLFVETLFESIFFKFCCFSEIWRFLTQNQDVFGAKIIFKEKLKISLKNLFSDKKVFPGKYFLKEKFQEFHGTQQNK